MAIFKNDIEKIRTEFEPVEGSKLATALERCEQAIEKLDQLQTIAAGYHRQGGRADSFLNRLNNYAVDLAQDDLLQTVKDAQATAAAVAAIDAPMRTLIQQAKDDHENRSSQVNNLAKHLHDAKRSRDPNKLPFRLNKYAGHELPQSFAERTKKRIRRRVVV